MLRYSEIVCNLMTPFKRANKYKNKIKKIKKIKKCFIETICLPLNVFCENFTELWFAACITPCLTFS